MTAAYAGAHTVYNKEMGWGFCQKLQGWCMPAFVKHHGFPSPQDGEMLALRHAFRSRS